MVLQGSKLVPYTPSVDADIALADEVRQSLRAQIDATLAEAGTDKTKIIKANIWLTNIATFAEMNSQWDAWVVPGQTPARATVEAKLAAPGIDVEIMVEAALD